MVIVEAVWKEVLPSGTQLLNSEVFLGRDVDWVQVLKPRPPGLDAPRGNEMILISTQTLSALDPHLSLARLLQSVSGHVAAVAVRGETPPDAIEEAERQRLPLFQLPGAVSLGGLERGILRFLSEQRGEWYRRKHSLLQDLTAMAVQGLGLEAIARQMGEVTGHAIVIEDERGDVLTSYVPSHCEQGHREILDAYLTGDVSIPEAAFSKGRALSGQDELRRLSAALTVRDNRVGTISLIGPAGTLNGDSRLVLEAGATAGAVELAREHAVRETVHRIQGDFLSDLVNGAGDIRDLERRARRMGYDLDGARAAIAFLPVSERNEDIDDPLPSLARRLGRILGQYEVQAPFQADHGLLTLFYPLEQTMSPASLKRLAERLCTDLADAARRHRLYAGVSRVHTGPGSYRTSFEEARRALELGRALTPDRNITYFGDLGVYRLLFSMRETREMEEFYNDMLGLLATYDREKNAELVRTLDAYLCSNNATEVAERLNLHRNSLLYRLRRIGEITGLDLDDPETRLALHLAIRVGETLRTVSAIDG